MFPVADLCDAFEDHVHIVEPMFTDFGGRLAFGGPISTIKCFEDNSEVRLALEEPGEGRVLVVDGGGSDRCALLGDNLARMAMDNAWAGIVIYGCIRDAEALSQLDIGIKALNSHPKRSTKKHNGERDLALWFGGVSFVPEHWLYADLDGIVVSSAELSL